MITDGVPTGDVEHSVGRTAICYEKALQQCWLPD